MISIRRKWMIFMSVGVRVITEKNERTEKWTAEDKSAT